MKLNLNYLLLLVVVLVLAYFAYPKVVSLFKKEKFESYKECLKRTGSEEICV